MTLFSILLQNNYESRNDLGQNGKIPYKSLSSVGAPHFCREHDIPLIRIPYYDYDKYMTELISSCSENKK